MGLVVISNVLFIAYEANAAVKCEDMNEDERMSTLQCDAVAIRYVNLIFICIYVVEMNLRLFVKGPVAFLKHWLNVVDMIVIGFGIFEFISDLWLIASGDMPNVEMLKIF